jgi:hypothetical protein
VKGEAVSESVTKNVHADHPVALLEEVANVTAFDGKNG